MFDDLLILLDDELLMSFLGYGLGSGISVPAQPGIGKHRGLRRFPKWFKNRRDEETYEEYEYRMMLEASAPPAEMTLRAEGRDHQLAALRMSNYWRSVQSGLNPSPEPMTQEDKKKLEKPKIIRGLESAGRRQEEQEQYKKQIAMNVRMAKVRAAKRKK